MSTTTNKLQLKFTDSNDKNISFNYSHAKANPTAANVKSLMQGIITNNAIFQKTPSAMVAANLITTTTTSIDIS